MVHYRTNDMELKEAWEHEIYLADFKTYSMTKENMRNNSVYARRASQLATVQKHYRNGGIIWRKEECK